MRTIINELDNFKHSYSINDYILEPWRGSPCASRYIEIDEWLTNNIVDFIMGWYEGGQFGYWCLGVNNEEDFVAFKLKFNKLR